ncbi:glycyl-tRNA synthetase [Chthoniobacter flavus Ellin428]|uniref:glycine--tRNA ligase n=1 Tax=Chthoniobacter flavus Ellin428 TaxID=497964 RepID=B4D392_9BACT|nr:glycine--tRNA ligase [Chthoniobacter flavus]EDY19203.1 glycyl-tRNA synthetase [Chthoniobacter flavus Ellin428]
MSQPKEIPQMEKIVSLAKRRGFVFQSSEIYGGINGFWDYGPLGAELKRNLRDTWWRTMTRDREDVVGLDATIIMHPAIWKASGHVDTFADLMRECSVTNKRVRADHVEPQSGVVMQFSGFSITGGSSHNDSITVLMRGGEHIESFRKRVRQLVAQARNQTAENIELHGESKIDAVEGSVDFHPETGGALGEARPFNLMLKTYVGPTATENDIAYLRPETAQAIFAQFKNVVDSSRQRVPFGICQIGKAFRNEVTPRNFTFRSREFEQMELEFFIKPDEAIEAVCGSVAAWSEGADLSVPQDNWGWEMWHRYWVKERTDYYAGIGLGADVLDYHWQTKEELAHYARACVDILFKFPFGTEELEGLAARGDFDLMAHQTASRKPMDVFDEEVKNAFAKWTDEQRAALVERKKAEHRAKEKGGLTDAQVDEWCQKLFKGFYVPHVIEPSAGLDRLALAVLSNAYSEVEKTDAKGKSETLYVMRLHPRLAPVKVGVFPLLKNKPELVAKAREVFELLRKHFSAFYDEGGSIGKRYARQDEAGTPFCLTIDFETLGEKGEELKDTVTLRHRDDGSKERVKISELLGKLLPMVG